MKWLKENIEKDNKELEKLKLKLFETIAAGLSRRPAYLLIFGICALFVLGGFGITIYGIIHDDPVKYVGFISLVVALIVAYLTIKKVEEGGKKYDEILSELSLGLPKAINVALTNDNRIFRDAMLTEIRNFQENVKDWTDGIIKVEGCKSNELLIRQYSNAKKSIFSTSIIDYNSNWQSDFGTTLLRVHKNNKDEVKITRVFIFKQKSDIDKKQVNIMKDQKEKGGIDVCLYFEECNVVNFPSTGKDFTIIDDGEAIGITVSFGPDKMGAFWYFNNENKKLIYLKICQSLKCSMISFDKFYEENC